MIEYLEAICDTTDEELQRYAEQIGKDAAQEVGASPAAPYVMHHQVEQAATLAVLKAFGLEPTHIEEGEI